MNVGEKGSGKSEEWKNQEQKDPKTDDTRRPRGTVGHEHPLQYTGFEQERWMDSP